MGRQRFRRRGRRDQIVIALRPFDEGWNQLIQFAVNRRAERLRFAQVVRVELADQILERLAGAEHADVGQRRRRQITAQHVAGLRPHRGAVGGLGPAL